MPLTVAVHMVTGHVINVNCKKMETVGSLKTRLQKITGMRKPVQDILFAGVPLQDDVFVHKCNVSEREFTHFELQYRPAFS